MRILYLDLDAVSPRHLSCYGYGRPTSPAIDALAAEGVRFTGCYAADAPCLPSRTGLYSGRFGIHTGVVGHGGTAAQPKPEADRDFRDSFDKHGLARQLQRAGFHTAMVSPFGQRHAAHWFYAGFNEVHNTGKGGMETVADVQPVVDKWLDDHAADDGWFLHVNYWDAHTPYRVPPGVEYPDVTDGPLPEAGFGWLTDDVLARHVAKGGPHSAQDLGMYGDADTEHFPRQPARITDRPSLKRYVDGYDAAIRHIDEALAGVFDKLKAAGVWDETAVIVSADHGENQGQLGLYGEHATADQATCNVPLIIKWPGGSRGAVNDKLHYQLDLAPTLTDLLGLDAPEIWDGRSYAGAVRGEAGVGRDEVVVSQCAHVLQRSVRFDAGPHRWLYVRTYHCGFHLFPKQMLFDLAADPNEQHDLAADRPDVCREAAWRLADWHDGQMARMAERAGCAGDVADPLWTVLREGGPAHANLLGTGQPRDFAGYLQRLRDTGRAGHADRLAAKYLAQT